MLTQKYREIKHNHLTSLDTSTKQWSSVRNILDTQERYLWYLIRFNPPREQLPLKMFPCVRESAWFPVSARVVGWISISSCLYHFPSSSYLYGNPVTRFLDSLLRGHASRPALKGISHTNIISTLYCVGLPYTGLLDSLSILLFFWLVHFFLCPWPAGTTVDPRIEFRTKSILTWYSWEYSQAEQSYQSLTSI